jgi:hypothetical protein
VNTNQIIKLDECMIEAQKSIEEATAMQDWKAVAKAKKKVEKCVNLSNRMSEKSLEQDHKESVIHVQPTRKVRRIPEYNGNGFEGD